MGQGGVRTAVRRSGNAAEAPSSPHATNISVIGAIDLGEHSRAVHVDVDACNRVACVPRETLTDGDVFAFSRVPS